MHRGLLRVAVNFGPRAVDAALECAEPPEVLLCSAEAVLTAGSVHLPAELFALVTIAESVVTWNPKGR
jgi:hypothetical protein